ncbi:hypothetical protein BDZ89DRAFT_1051109 [Hymenopellis radicata]|nr:hypothetical protein BDZ89DRAFT_1051109 [Hymenopellis radicata]
MTHESSRVESDTSLSLTYFDVSSAEEAAVIETCFKIRELVLRSDVCHMLMGLTAALQRQMIREKYRSAGATLFRTLRSEDVLKAVPGERLDPNRDHHESHESGEYSRINSDSQGQILDSTRLASQGDSSQYCDFKMMPDASFRFRHQTLNQIMRSHIPSGCTSTESLHHTTTMYDEPPDGLPENLDAASRAAHHRLKTFIAAQREMHKALVNRYMTKDIGIFQDASTDEEEAPTVLRLQ